jgi:uncharacterized protein (DUF2236 family)
LVTSRYHFLFAYTTCALLCSVLSCFVTAPARADPRQLSLMPDPRGEFIRLCAPFMAPRYARPEAVCDCVRNAMFDQVDDVEMLDALLYGVTERGVPTLNRAWLQAEKWPRIETTMTAIAEPTMECMFGAGAEMRLRESVPPDGPVGMPPVQDLTP